MCARYPARQQDHQHDRGDTAFGTQRLHLSANLIPFTDGLSDAVQDFCEIAAHLAVNCYGLGYPGEIVTAHPGGRVGYRIIPSDPDCHAP